MQRTEEDQIETTEPDELSNQLLSKAKLKQSRSVFTRSEKKKPEKAAFVNQAMQKTFFALRKTSRSRFDGVKKYYNGAFVSK